MRRVLIPARNEVRHIEEALRSVIVQGSLVKEILVYDDHSDDGTGALVESIGEESPLIRLLQPEPLREGWMVKPFACAQLGAAASGEWLLFLDADTRLHAGAVPLMLGETERHGISFLSCWPALLSDSFWEHVFMPILNFVVFSIFATPMQTSDADFTAAFADADHELIQNYLNLFASLDGKQVFSAFDIDVEIALGEKTFGAVKKSAVTIIKSQWPNASIHELARTGHQPLVKGAQALRKIIFRDLSRTTSSS